jgi:hypothetical protein
MSDFAWKLAQEKQINRSELDQKMVQIPPVKCENVRDREKGQKQERNVLFYSYAYDKCEYIENGAAYGNQKRHYAEYFSQCNKNRHFCCFFFKFNFVCLFFSFKNEKWKIL